MPRTLVRDEVERVVSKTSDVSSHDLAADLAKTFRVSAAAMLYRLTNLGVLDPQT
jgi:hypothetical protein